jgi:hypothetical protein
VLDGGEFDPKSCKVKLPMWASADDTACPQLAWWWHAGEIPMGMPTCTCLDICPFFLACLSHCYNLFLQSTCYLSL